MDIEDSSEEEEVVEKPAPKPRGRPKGKTAPKKTPARAAKKKAQDDMDESSSEEELELDMETFDTQALVESEEDKKYLDSLPEFEREAILGERFEKLKAAADMKKALRESKYVMIQCMNIMCTPLC
jgi:RNA polymerase-associated protein RTF1